jgi:hypothetical protein
MKYYESNSDGANNVADGGVALDAHTRGVSTPYRLPVP